MFLRQLGVGNTNGGLPFRPIARAFIGAEGTVLAGMYEGLTVLPRIGANQYEITTNRVFDPFRCIPAVYLASFTNGQIDAVVWDENTIIVLTYDGAGVADERGFNIIVWVF